jgi:hypothetical protein
MKKKGIAPATLVTLVIAVALIIGVGIFLARSSGEAKAEGFSLGYGKFPEETSPVGGSTPGSSEPLPIIPEVVTTFVKAIEQAKNSEKEICRVEFEEYPGSDDLNVRLMREGDNMKVVVQINHKVPFVLEEFENIVPCVVHGDNFRELLMTGNKNDPQYMDISSAVIIKKDEMVIKLTTEGANVKLFEDNPLIYKAGTGHICLVPTFNDFWNSDCSDKGSREIHYVDNDCIREGVIKGYGNHIPPC